MTLLARCPHRLYVPTISIKIYTYLFTTSFHTSLTPIKQPPETIEGNTCSSASVPEGPQTTHQGVQGGGALPTSDSPSMHSSPSKEVQGVQGGGAVPVSDSPSPTDTPSENHKAESTESSEEIPVANGKDEGEPDRGSSSSSGSGSSSGSSLNISSNSAPRKPSFDRASTASLSSFGDLADIYHKGEKAIEKRDYIVMEISIT